MAQWHIRSREGVNYVETFLQNETVRTEAGAMRAMHGSLQMEAKAPGLGGLLKAAVSGETIFRPSYTGTGRLILEPSLGGFFTIEMRGETLVLDHGAYWASDASVEVSAQMNRLANTLFGGEGWWQTTARGAGTVVVATPGPVELIELSNDRLSVDGTFAVARDASLSYRVDKATRSLFGSAFSGEGLVSTFEGTGRVWLAPVPYLHAMLRDVLGQSVAEAVRRSMPSSGS